MTLDVFVTLGDVMQIENIQYYLEVLKAGSITKAAQNVYISQQGLSKSIQALEKDLHVRLLKRSSNGKMVPTDAGREFKESAEQIITVWDSLKEQLMHYSSDGSSKMELRQVRFLLTPYLANMLNFIFTEDALLNRHKSEMIVLEKNYDEICSSLLANPKHTVAIINATPSILDELHDTGLYEFSPILKMNLMLKCSPHFIVGRKKTLSIDEVKRVPIALYREPLLSAVIESTFGEHTLNLVMHTTNSDQIRNVVARADAATFTDTFAEMLYGNEERKNPYTSEYVSIPIQNATPIFVGFLKRKDTERSPMCSKYEAFCQNYINMKFDLYIKRHPVKE